jgi:hypothetical protein
MCGGGHGSFNRRRGFLWRVQDVGLEAAVDGIHGVVDGNVHHGIHERFVEGVDTPGAGGLAGIRIPICDRIRPHESRPYQAEGEKTDADARRERSHGSSFCRRGRLHRCQASKTGIFEATSKGTPFLDEINTLPLPLQNKLLTAGEERRVRRVGAVAAHSVDVKHIAATQAKLSSHDATAESPTTCITERYVSLGGKT